MIYPSWCVRDLRGPDAWTPEDKARTAEYAIVHPAWERNPMPGSKTLVHTGPTMYLYNGKPAGSPGSLLYRVADEAMKHGYDILPTRPKQGRVELWWSDDGRQQLFALNIARREVALWLGRVIAESCPWAQGFQLDYWTSLQWIWDNPAYRARAGTTGVLYPDTYWSDWDSGLLSLSGAIRAHRDPVILVGQQWHNSAPPYTPMKRLNGRFIEDYPTRWMPLASHELLIRAWGTSVSRESPIVFMVELRDPGNFSVDYQRTLIDWCAALGLVLVWGRDANALKGRP